MSYEINILNYTKCCIIQKKIWRSSLTSFAHFLFNPSMCPHQLSSASSTFATTPPPHRCFTISLLYLFANFPFILSFSLPPSLPASPSTLLWTGPCVWGPRGLSLGRWFDLWLGKCFEESWEGPGAWTGGLYLDLLSTQKMGETAAPLMHRYLNWQCSPVLTVWCVSPSI